MCADIETVASEDALGSVSVESVLSPVLSSLFGVDTTEETAALASQLAALSLKTHGLARK